MSDYYDINHTSLPAIYSPRGTSNYGRSNPGYSTQRTSPYGQPNPPPSNHPAFNNEARNGNYRSNKPQDKILHTVFYLCGQHRCFEREPSEHCPRPRYSIQKSLCYNYKICERCRKVQFHSSRIEPASRREKLRALINSKLLELWTAKGRLFTDRFVDSNNKPPPFDSMQIMYVISEVVHNELGNKTTNLQQNREEQVERGRRQRRRRERPAGVASESTLQNRSSQMPLPDGTLR